MLERRVCILLVPRLARTLVCVCVCVCGIVGFVTTPDCTSLSLSFMGGSIAPRACVRPFLLSVCLCGHVVSFASLSYASSGATCDSPSRASGRTTPLWRATTIRRAVLCALAIPEVFS